jgi:hypothetical protein
MKTIYIIYTERYGENNLVFDSKLKCIDGWSCNDATWRDEYFNGLMKQLGIEVLSELPEGTDEDKVISKGLVSQFGKGADKE